MLGAILMATLATTASVPTFTGKHFDGEGDVAYLQALDDAYSMLRPSPTMACLPMLYMKEWNGFVEGPTWNAWWIQNSFGPSYTMMPFLGEPYRTWMANSQALWFNLMGDGKRPDQNGFVAPLGCLCDAATPKMVYYRQGDGNVASHDWCIGFTAAGLILECELMLIQRDKAEIVRMLPKLEQVAAFLDSRRDPEKNLLLGGVASNLLAPSYGGWVGPDGKRQKAFLSELSVNYVAGLRKLAEVCKLAGRNTKALAYLETAEKVRSALTQLVGPDGTFCQALAPDGTKQGVFGAAKSGYFESAPNHDAICFRVVEDEQAKKIYAKIASIPELRPHKLILPNYPTYDHMYETGGLFTYGVWVNGGHWTTAEARMMMGYYRVEAQADALASFSRIRDLAKAFRADNNLTDRGAKLYQPGQPYNVVYDCWGAPGAFLRGLFEYEYAADGLRLYPHVPAGVTKLVQKLPVMFGKTKLWLSVAGRGPVTGVVVDGRSAKASDSASVWLRLDGSDRDKTVQVLLGGAKPFPTRPPTTPTMLIPSEPKFWRTSDLQPPPSGNFNRLCIGISPSGSYGLKGQIRDVRIYERALRADEIGGDVPAAGPLLARYLLREAIGDEVAGAKDKAWNARFEGKTKPRMKEGALDLDGESGLSIQPSLATDLQADFTFELWIRPEALPQGGSRLVDRCTVGGQDGPNLDFIDAGKTLRLIVATGVVQAPVDLQAGQWRHVAATCDASGTIKLYLDRRLVGEKQIPKIAYPSVRAAPVDLAKVGRFLALLRTANREASYAGKHAALVIEMLDALHRYRALAAAGKVARPKLPGIPAPREYMVEQLYVGTVAKLAEGLVDVVRALPERDPIAKAAKAAGLR